MNGILASFIGASLQSLNYLSTQSSGNKLTTIQTLSAIHVGMGVIALPCLLFSGLLLQLGWGDLYSLMLVNVPYLLAQLLLLLAINRTDASTVSPLLSLKIPALALIAFCQSGHLLTLNQALSMLLIVALSFGLCRLNSHQRTSLLPLLLITGTSICYCLSDIAILAFSHKLASPSLYQRAFATVIINYSFCALLSLPIFVALRTPPRALLDLKIPAISWIAAVFFLIIGFNQSGVLSANVIQSTRGIISIVVAFFLFHTTHSHRDWLKRLGISLGMSLSVLLFFL